MARELVDLKGVVRGETDAAIRLVVDGTAAWLPKSQVEDNGDGTFTLPLWLAEEKGLV